MTTTPSEAPHRDTRSGLLGRRPQCTVLDDLVGGLRDGRSGALVLSGVPGIGKSELLEYAVASAGRDVRVVRASGLPTETDLPYAGLHQLCSPLLEQLTGLPAPQRGALETVFGGRVGLPPDRLVVCLAVLGLLSQASRTRPLLCAVDDAQWIDAVSAQVLGFVGRRLPARPVGLLVATRQVRDHLLGLPQLEVGALGEADAHALLQRVTHTWRDARVRDRIVAEAGGNPFTLLESARGLGETHVTVGFGPARAADAAGPVEPSLAARIQVLPARSQLLMLVAAADPVGDPTLVRQAADRLGVAPAATFDEATDGLLAEQDPVMFRHPLARSAVYAAATGKDRRAVHRALAEVTDRQLEPDRRAWHLAAAAAGPDESVATELERSARHARARGGLAAAAAFLQRAAALTQDASRRADRALAAAGASLRAGDVDTARRHVDAAERHAPGEPLRARAARLRGAISLDYGSPDDACALLLGAVGGLRTTHPDLAGETCLLAWAAAVASDDAAALGEVCRTAATLSGPVATASPAHLLVDALAAIGAGDRASALTLLQTAAAGVLRLDDEQTLAWGWVAGTICAVLWDETTMVALSTRQLRIARDVGAVSQLPRDLDAVALATAWTGDLAAASALATEAGRRAETTGVPLTAAAALHLAALRGDEAQVCALLDTVPAAGGGGRGTARASWSSAVLFNGLARYDQALSAARASAASADPAVAAWALPELVEAACRCGDRDLACQAVERLLDVTKPCDTDWAAGVSARCRALIADGDDADALFQESVDRLGRTGLRPELARAHLLRGEWLRRRGQRVEARTHLRSARDLFGSIGMEAFSERARRELLATGETLRRSPVQVTSTPELTPQQWQIALLVRAGLSNPEVGARLFLSPRTVEWHLRQIFARLSISSRRQLRDVLPPGSDPATELEADRA